MPQTTKKEGNAQRQQGIGQNGANQRGAHHVEHAGIKRHKRNDEFRRITERGVEQATNGITGA